MSAQKSILLGVFAAVVVALGIAAASWVYTPRAVELKSGTLLQAPRALPEFALLDHDGAPFTHRQLEGRWSLVFAGFTRCPDVCPTTLALLKQVNARLPGGGAHVVFLSVDPERDTPAALKTYTTYFDPSFTGVTAREPQLGEFARALGLAYAKVPGTTPDTYDMDHSAALVLIDPQGRIAGYLSPPFDPAALAADLGSVMGRKA
ncbi:MAG TPA: SCO family protein [Solimonas sp.]|nr:SCO family protein [Solimonas sp.]